MSTILRRLELNQTYKVDDKSTSSALNDVNVKKEKNGVLRARSCV